MAETFILKDLLKEKAEMFHVKLDETALERFDIYGKLLVEWNEKINLTAITDPEGVTIKHFLDSLTIFSYVDIPEGAKVIDVGTGAGFPGLAMLIARPDLQMTLMDQSIHTRCFVCISYILVQFLRYFQELLLYRRRLQKLLLQHVNISLLRLFPLYFRPILQCFLLLEYLSFYC